MLARRDAALIIGDVALFLDDAAADVQKIDLGEVWTRSTGLPFVYAVWAGWPGAVTPDDVAAAAARPRRGRRAVGRGRGAPTIRTTPAGRRSAAGTCAIISGTIWATTSSKG